MYKILNHDINNQIFFNSIIKSYLNVVTRIKLLLCYRNKIVYQ